MDHDQRFKVLLCEFFVEFIRLFFAAWAERFDFSRIEWLDKETFVNPPRGERGAVDLIAKLATREPVGDPWLVLLHLEVESADKVAPFRRRVFEYYEFLRREHNLPVLPIGVFLRVGLNGVGWDVYEEHFWEQRLLHFEYAYIGLPALDAEQYVQHENLLGVALAALMRVPEEQRVALKERAFNRIAASAENDARRYLLFECVDAYLSLHGPQLVEFEAWLDRQANPEVKIMGTTFLGKARQEGLVEGQRKTLRTLLEARFGPLPPTAQLRLESLSADRLDELTRVVLAARSLQDVGLAD